MKSWTAGQIVILWVAAAVFLFLAFLGFGWLDLSYGYSAAQQSQGIVYFLAVCGFVVLMLLGITWRWLGMKNRCTE